MLAKHSITIITVTALSLAFASAEEGYLPDTGPKGVFIEKEKKGSVYLETEAMFLKANSESLNQLNFGFAIPGLINFGFPLPDTEEYEILPRVTLGFEDAGGLGVRFRMFRYDSSRGSNVATIPVLGGINLASTYGLDLDSYDIEFTSRHQLCQLDLLGFFGVRYFDAAEALGVVVTAPGLAANFNNTRTFDGLGLTAGIEARRDFVGLPLAAVAKGRISYLPADGDSNTRISVPAVPITALIRQGITDDIWTYEGFVGLEHSRCTSLGELAILGGVEAQKWADFSGTDIDLNLVGFTFGVKLNVD